jgi:MFS family permease
MGDWLRLPDGGFTYIFGFTGLLFLLGAALTRLLEEGADEVAVVTTKRAHPFADAWQVLRTDRNFRRFSVVVMLTMVGTVLFPHYQALAREELGLAGGNLMIWVVVQNASVGGFGLLLGWIVHHRGERLALRLTILAGALAPLTALVLAYADPVDGARWYWTVFIPIGMTPLVMKTMVGYTLEIAPPHDHPRYLSTLSLCLAVPFCFSPLVGWFVDEFGFEPVFAGGAALIVLAGLLTLRLVEPRHDSDAKRAGIAATAGEA